MITNKLTNNISQPFKTAYSLLKEIDMDIKLLSDKKKVNLEALKEILKLNENKQDDVEPNNAYSKKKPPNSWNPPSTPN